MRHDGHEPASKSDDRRWERKGPLKHLDARQRKKFHDDLGFAYPLYIMGGLGLTAGTITASATPYLWQGIVSMLSGTGMLISGVSLMIHTFVEYGIGPPRKDYWDMRAGRRLQIAVGPGVIVGRW